MELQRKEEEKKQFKFGVATFYDEFSGQWEHIYESDHIHHGFYDPNSTEPVDHHSEWRVQSTCPTKKRFDFLPNNNTQINLLTCLYRFTEDKLIIDLL